MNLYGLSIFSSSSVVVRRLFLLFLAVLLSGCVTASKSYRDDPLIGTIIDSDDQQTLTFEQLVERAAVADVVYLAEKHDNADQHAAQVKIIEELVKRGLKPVIGFEFFDVGETGLLTQFALGKPSTMKLKSSVKMPSAEDRLRTKLGWEKQDDEYWGYYFRLIELARSHQLDIFGADLPQGIKTRISRGGLEVLNALELSQLNPSGYDDPAYQALMYEQFRQGHCGWGQEDLLRRLYQTWIARNDRMAASIAEMSQESRQGPLVIILGNGHVRHNMGVYERVAFLAPELKQFNMGFREIAIDPLPVSEYVASEIVEGNTFAPIHEVLWFTQRQDYGDACKGFHKPK
ncbi:MAG: ChaN family lipoprotein [Motiliproteus sp.]